MLIKQNFGHNMTSGGQFCINLNYFFLYIADQIPLLGIGMQIHEKKVPAELKPLHEQMETLFEASPFEKKGLKTLQTSSFLS